MLIQHGADVNVIAPRETALSVTAKAGSENMLYFLLAYGADLHVTVPTLRAVGSTEPGANAIKRLTTSVARYRNDMPLHTRKVRKEIVRLRREFRDEHCGMTKVAAPPVYWKYLSKGPNSSDMWIFCLEGEPREAWCIALRTLRGLCNGVLPDNLNETLLFIVLSKVMSSLVYGSDDDGAAAEFNQDLGRWQLLFNPARGGLEVFQGAVRAI